MRWRSGDRFRVHFAGGTGGLCGGGPLCKRLLTTVIVYMAFSLLMAVLWSLLQTPDLAITEAAVGAGITSILFFLTLKKIHALKGTRDE